MAIDRNKINADLSQIQQTAQQIGIPDINNISEQERQQLIRQLETEISKRKQMGIGSSVGKAIGGAIQPFTSGRSYFGTQSGVGSVETGMPNKQPSQLDELIKLKKLDYEEQANKLKLEEQAAKVADLKRKQAYQDELQTRLDTQESGGIDTPTKNIPTSSMDTTTKNILPKTLPTETPRRYTTEITRDESGNLKEERVENPEFKTYQKAQEKLATDRAEKVGELASGQRISFNNLEKVTGAISDLDRVFTAGHERGELGSIGADAAFTLAKTLGGKQQDKYQNASAMPGKKAEVLFNMIPMLTQQGEKPGSVRIMRSVLTLLGQTLPDNRTGLEAGRRMMAESIKSFYRFARAAELSGLDFDSQFQNRDLNTISDDELGGWISNVNRASKRVRLKPNEEEALNNFIDSSLLASGNLIKERKAGKITNGQVNEGNIKSISLLEE